MAAVGPPIGPDTSTAGRDHPRGLEESGHGPSDFRGPGRADPNDHGTVAFIAGLDDGNAGFYIVRDGLVEEVIRRLDPLFGSLKKTWVGDANLDGEFNSSDLVRVFAAGKYETVQEAGWAEGNWNGSGYFDSGDMVTAFVDGGYEKAPRTSVDAVPEPCGWLLLATSLSWLRRRFERSTARGA